MKNVKTELRYGKPRQNVSYLVAKVRVLTIDFWQGDLPAYTRVRDSLNDVIWCMP